MNLENMSILEIKERIEKLEKYEKLVLSVGEGSFERYKDTLIRKRIELYPEKPLSKILDTEYDLVQDILSNFEQSV